jgi:uncharacterized protein YdeI (YjbR/CyaY-like superfamily)
MSIKIESVDTYFQSGCGRCNKFDTPACRVHKWKSELAAMRTLCLEAGLQEELKWSHPCYTHQGKNIVILGAFNEYCSFNFIKGGLLKDEAGLLDNNGENSQSSKMLKATCIGDILDHQDLIKAYIAEAIAVEQSGQKVASKSVSEYAMPEELELKFKQDPAYHEAFQKLTPGRQKAYLLLFGQAKQAATRHARIEKYIPHVMAGKGPHDDYKC